MWAITSSTIITKFMSTPTCHRATPCCSFHPEIAPWTLLEFGSFHKLFKLFIIFSIRVCNSILCTCLAIMVVAPTSQTIMFPTNRASVICNLFFSSENCCAAWSRAPWNMLIICLNVVIKTKFIIFLSRLAITALVNNIDWNMRPTTSWTFDLNFLFPQTSFNVFGNAMPMEWVAAFKSFQIKIFYW